MAHDGHCMSLVSMQQCHPTVRQLHSWQLHSFASGDCSSIAGGVVLDERACSATAPVKVLTTAGLHDCGVYAYSACLLFCSDVAAMLAAQLQEFSACSLAGPTSLMPCLWPTSTLQLHAQMGGSLLTFV